VIRWKEIEERIPRLSRKEAPQMAIATSTEVQALEAEQEKLTRLYTRAMEAEDRIRTLRARHDALEVELGAAAVDDNTKRVAAIRKEMQQTKDDVSAAEIEELALRKAGSEQSARVSALREPVQRLRVEAAFRAWLEYLPQIEAFVAEVELVQGVAGALGFGTERTRDPFTGAQLTWCPSQGQLVNWRTMTSELQVRLRRAGYDV
jgi:chromosome segregation ATPase